MVADGEEFPSDEDRAIEEVRNEVSEAVKTVFLAYCKQKTNDPALDGLETSEIRFAILEAVMFTACIGIVAAMKLDDLNVDKAHALYEKFAKGLVQLADKQERKKKRKE